VAALTGFCATDLGSAFDGTLGATLVGAVCSVVAWTVGCHRRCVF
jgi:hypothetical protein